MPFPVLSPRPRRLSRARALAVLTAAAMAPAGIAAVPGSASADAARASAPKIDSTYVSGAPTTVKSSSGKKLKLSVFASKSAHGANLGVTLANAKGESHQWNFTVPAKAVRVDRKGAGKVVSGAKLGKYGTVSLSVEPAGKIKTLRCNGTAYAKSRKVVLRGKMLFDTHSTGKSKWGKVGAKGFRFAAPSTVGWSFAGVAVDCAPDGVSMCTTGTSWNAGDYSTVPVVSLFGATEGSRGYVTGIRSVSLPKPKDAMRFDIVRRSTPAPTITTEGSTTTLRITGAGSGTLTSETEPMTYETQCGGKTQVWTNWSPATFRNGSTPLRLSAQVFGAFTVKDGSTGSFSRVRTK